MAALILFALLFLCGLLNSLFFPSSKLLPWLHSLLLSAIYPPKPKPAKPDLNIKGHKDNRSDEFSSDSSNLKTLFATFDADGDGFISVAELNHSLRRLGLHATAEDLTSMIQRVDSNGDGLIDLSEFSELCISLGSEGEAGKAEDRELREAFQVFDGDGDGMITVEELSLVLKSLGLRQGDRAESCRDMISRVDLDGDGMVNFEEFKRMMVVDGGVKFF